MISMNSKNKVPFNKGRAVIEDPTTGEMIRVDARIEVPCGEVAELDRESGTGGYRCTTCNAILGSAGMPRTCYDLYKAQENS